MIVDEKISVWVRSRVSVEAETLEEAIEKCIHSDFLESESETLYDTAEAITPNKNLPTYEIYLDDASYPEPIYTNAIK